MLRVQDGTAERQYTVPELIDAIGLTELRVAKNPHFGPDRVFAGFAMEPLLNHIGLADANVDEKTFCPNFTQLETYRPIRKRKPLTRQ